MTHRTHRDPSLGAPGGVEVRWVRVIFVPGQRLTGIGLFVCAVCAALAAQTAQQRPTFRSGIDLIEVDVSVVDDDSLPIVDLQPSEFSVTVDGEPRRVLQAHFDWLRPPDRDAGRPEPAAEDVFSTSNADATRGRLVVIAVDEESILFGEGREVMRAASAFVDSLSPGDRVSLLAVPQPGVYIDFTLDHDHVSRAVAGMSGLGRRRVGVGELNISLFEAFQIAEHYNDEIRNAVIDRLCGGGPASVGCVEQVPAEARDIVQQSRFHADQMRRGLESILEALRNVEGPKALVWISGGHVVDGAGLTLRQIEDLVVAARTTLYVIMVDDPLAGDITQASSVSTPRQDRRMKEEGLHLVAAMSRGTVFRAHFNPGPIFDRLEKEMSGYYLLGVESRPTDQDKERRKIGVSVRREGARVRARREVSFTPEDPDQTVDERLARMLRSPVAIKDLPLRVATYVYQDTEGAPVRVLVAAEVDVLADVASELTLGFMLCDQDGKVVSSGQKRITPRVARGSYGLVLETTSTLTVEPGTYSLRLAVVDPAGRRGSVEHPVHVGPLSSRPLTVGDLLVADQSNGMRPPVEARVSSGRLFAYTELYADSSALWEEVEVYVDVGDDATGPARAEEATMTMEETEDSRRRVVSADVAVAHLPPGRYVARARVMHDSIEVARIRRPFRITSPYVPTSR